MHRNTTGSKPVDLHRKPALMIHHCKVSATRGCTQINVEPGNADTGAEGLFLGLSLYTGQEIAPCVTSF